MNLHRSLATDFIAGARERRIRGDSRGGAGNASRARRTRAIQCGIMLLTLRLPTLDLGNGTFPRGNADTPEMTLPIDAGDIAPEIRRALLEAAVVAAYARGDISDGYAGRLLGLARVDAQAFLSERGVYPNYGLKEFEEDLQTMEEFHTRFPDVGTPVPSPEPAA